MFDVDVAGDGQVDKAKVRESMINDREIVSCMEGALQAMSLPGVVTPLRSSGPVYGGSVSPEGRTPLGHPAAAAAVAGAAVNLIPIVPMCGNRRRRGRSMETRKTVGDVSWSAKIMTALGPRRGVPARTEPHSGVNRHAGSQ
ncbi:MAG TPA: hypothetical protein VM694_29425 [Polyangium sp.]|nr:hypothetical protein [Polyangium sp.]